MTITERDIAEALRALPGPATSADAAQAQVMSRVAHRVRRRRVTRASLALATAAAVAVGVAVWPAGDGASRLHVPPAKGTPTSRAPAELPSTLRGLAELTGAELRPLAAGVVDGREWVFGIGTQRGFDGQACVLAHDEVFDRLGLCFPDPLLRTEPVWEIIPGRHGATAVVGAAPAAVSGHDVTEVSLDFRGAQVRVPARAAWVSEGSVFFVHVFEGERRLSSVQLLSGGQPVSPPRAMSAPDEPQPNCTSGGPDCVTIVPVRDPPDR